MKWSRNRERELNPAYEPHYTSEDLRKASEYLAIIKEWHGPHNRPVRSLEVFRFLPALESLGLPFAEPADISPLAELPLLWKLQLGYHGSVNYNRACEDFTPLARCAALRDLELGFGFHWPDLTALGALTQLEALSLTGNLHAMPRAASFPSVRRGALYCMPLAARDVADLPQLPACEFLTLAGAKRLDGIEKMPRLHNLTLLGPFDSFEPLAALEELTWLTVGPRDHNVRGEQPRDLSPLVRLPKLQFFQIGPPYTSDDLPRDHAPLAEAPALRELIVQGCPAVEMEVAAVCAGLTPWDDVFLLPEPRPVPPLRMIIAPHPAIPHRQEPHRLSGEVGLVDVGIRECEGRWVAAYMARVISEQIGNSDWGALKANGEYHTFRLTVESFEVVERLPEIIDAGRSALADLRAEYVGFLSISLRVRPPEPTAAQAELDKILQEKRDQWEREQAERDQAEYLEGLHQLDLKKQQGDEIDPADFSPSKRTPSPQREDIEPPPEEPDDDSYLNADGDIAVKTEPDPPRVDFEEEDAHPLASNYSLAGALVLGEVWFFSHFRDIAVHLMQREPDEEIPDEEKTP